MKPIMILVGVLLLSSALLAADFSGTWVLNEDKSEIGEGRGGRAASQMVVEQKDNSLSIKSTRTGRNGDERTNEETLTLDGKETKSSTERSETVSTATMDRDVLTILQKRTFTRDGNTMESKSEQKWQLDGTTLVIDAKSESSRGERQMKLVYDKK